MLYNSRAWLSPNTHSGASLHCFYDPDNINPDFVCFIRITDCLHSFVLNRGVRKRKTFINELEGILLVLKKKRRTFSVTEGGDRYSFRYLTHPDMVTFDVVKTHSRKVIKLLGRTIEQKLLIRLHSDPKTRDHEEWDQKISSLISELEKFRSFLLKSLFISA